MKKLTVYLLLFLFMASFIKPFAGVISSAVSKYCWDVSYESLMKESKGRIHVLGMLHDVAAHNQSEKEHDSSPDYVKTAQGIFFVDLTQFNPLLFIPSRGVTYFSANTGNPYRIFSRISVPPPKG